MRPITLRSSLLALALLAPLSAVGCGEQTSDQDAREIHLEIQAGGVSHLIQGVWSVSPYQDPVTHKQYVTKVGDMSGNAFGSDPLTFGPFPTGYPMPADLKQCFWQRSYFLDDGTAKTDCECLISQVPADWAGTFNVATPPGGTSPVNLVMSIPGGTLKLYAPCYDRTDRGYIVDPMTGKITFKG